MHKHRFALTVGLAFGSVLAIPQWASGYAIPIHNQLTRRALSQSGFGVSAQPIDPAALAKLRDILDQHGRTSPKIEPLWKQRYPTTAAFDAFAQKQLLAFAAGSQVIGIDTVDKRLGPTSTVLDVMSVGAGQPDEDWRNRERLAYDAKREPIKDKFGQPVPADPALLNMGRLGGLSSQAHAHYGLAQVEFSGDSDMLKSEPRRFARAVGWDKGPILTLAAEMSQTHLDLSLIAALSDLPTATELSWQFTGQGFHYLSDVGNQIHTVQVGYYGFFVDAFQERLKLGLLTGGGYFGRMRSLGSIGIDILSNHHTLSEEFTFRRFSAALNGKGTPETDRLLHAPEQDDPEFVKKLDAALAKLGEHPERGEFGLYITRTLIDVSSDEGDDVYRATAAIAIPELRTRHLLFHEERDDPEKFVRPRNAKTEAGYAEFFALQERAFRRVGTAMRRWVSLEKTLLTSATTAEQKEQLRKEILDRFLSRQLQALAESETRINAYLADPPKNVNAPEHALELLVLELAIACLAIGIILKSIATDVHRNNKPRSSRSVKIKGDINVQK